MPRRDGEVFLFGTAMGSSSSKVTDVGVGRAYSRWNTAKLVGRPQACGRPWGLRHSPYIKSGEPAQAGVGPVGVAVVWIRQHRRHQGCLGWAQATGRLAEGPAGARLGAEFAIRPPFGDVEINLEDTPLAEHQVDPHGQGELQHLADVATAGPQEEILRDLLGDGGPAPHVLKIVRTGNGVADFSEIYPIMAAKAAVLSNDHRAFQVRRNTRKRHVDAVDAFADQTP